MCKLNATTTTTAALFTVKTEDKKENGPLMTGVINLSETDTVEIAAFAKTSKNGVDYLSLSIGDKGDKVYGALFRNQEKKAEKSPDYTGSIEIDRDNDVRLRVAGWKSKSKDGKTSYISIKIAPPLTKEDPSDDPHGDGIPF